MTPLQEWLLHHMPRPTGYKHDAELREHIAEQLANTLGPRLDLALMCLHNAEDTHDALATRMGILTAIRVLENITGECNTQEANPQ